MKSRCCLASSLRSCSTVMREKQFCLKKQFKPCYKYITPNPYFWVIRSNLPPQTCGFVWWRSLHSDEPLWYLRCGSCPVWQTKQVYLWVEQACKKWTVTSQNPRITCSNMLHYHPGNCGSCLNIDNVLMTTSELPCQCKSPPRKQTGILHPELRCRWSTPGSSSCAWKPAAGCGTPARSCPEIRQVWPRAWWCRASGSFGDREPSDNVQITAVPAPRGDHKYLRMVDSCACCSTSSAKTFSCCWNGSLW